MRSANLQLHPIIGRNLELMGYGQPRPIQAQAIGHILEGRDLIGLAQAGAGKTAAFIAPLAHALISVKPGRAGRAADAMSRLRALVLCPTRELAQQVADEAARIMQGSVLRVACVYGKAAISPQIRALERGVDLLVATPGRLRELLELDAWEGSLAYVRHIVLDEADRMLDMGFLPQVTAILDGIPTGADRQTLLFSATMPPEVEQLAARFLRDPVRIEVGRHTTPVEHVRQHLVPVSDRDKVKLLLHLIERGHGRGVLVFCRTRRRVGWVGGALARHGVAVGMLHGDRSQAQRQKALDRFAARELDVLVATDVAGRGLHVPAVKTVVNYDLPIAAEEYVHRIGRAGHGGGPGAAGDAFTLLSEDDRLRWRAVRDVTGIEVYAETVEGFEPSADGKGRRKREQVEGESFRDSSSKRRLKRARHQRRPRLSKRSRPIKKGQKPGRGVVRPQ